MPKDPKRDSRRPVTLLGLPYDAASSYRRGPAKAPERIRLQLNSPAGNEWTEAGGQLSRMLADGGDLALDNEGDARDAAGVNETIERGVAEVVRGGSKLLLLGGDHAVSFGAIRAVASQHKGLTVVQVDAHPDLYDEFEESRFSHACTFARVMETGLAGRLVQVGIRTATGHQLEQAKKFGVDMIDMRRWTRGDRPSVSGPVYLSIDLDGIDPAHAPGVSHQEPGGLTVREVITLIHEIGPLLVGADVVEYNPDVDVNDATARVAAKLVKELTHSLAVGSLSHQ